jgi:glucan phosphoethanolaminetransferase (alkaline phosphatase superfamily)
MAVPGLVFFLWARRHGVSPRLRKFALLFFCTFAGATTILTVCSILVVRLFPPAVVLLAAGIATQVARLAATRQRGFHQFFVRTSQAIVGFALFCALTAQARYWWTEHRSLQSLPAAEEGAPNILLLVLDTVRAKSMSLYGYAKDTTPNLQR